MSIVISTILELCRTKMIYLIVFYSDTMFYEHLSIYLVHRTVFVCLSSRFDCPRLPSSFSHSVRKFFISYNNWQHYLPLPFFLPPFRRNIYQQALFSQPKTYPLLFPLSYSFQYFSFLSYLLQSFLIPHFICPCNLIYPLHTHISNTC